MGGHEIWAINDAGDTASYCTCKCKEALDVANKATQFVESISLALAEGYTRNFFSLTFFAPHRVLNHSSIFVMKSMLPISSSSSQR